MVRLKTIAIFLGPWLAWLASTLGGLEVSNGTNYSLRIGTGGALIVVGEEPDWDSAAFVRPYWYQRGIALGAAFPWPWFRSWTIGPQTGVEVPSWPVVLPALVWWSYRHWRARSTRRPGVCHACGYDLAGNKSGRCPECGRAVGRSVAQEGRQR
jgi:hypothetical protein